MTNKLLIAAFFYVNFVTNTDGTKCINKSSEFISDYTQATIITSLLNNAKDLLEDAKSYAVSKTSCSMPIDCAAILEANPAAQSGIYRIWPQSRVIEGFIEVYCDMEDEGGAWTVIQRRGDFDSGQEYFYQDWDACKRSFGDLQKDFWLGNDNIFAVTNQRVNTVKFVLRDWERNTTYATYDNFWIEDEIRNYTVHVKGYRGTAGDCFSYHDGAQFSTKDRDNDDSSSGNCARHAAWWYKNCGYSSLNGWYLKRAFETGNEDGVHWDTFRGHLYSLKESVIKIRSKTYNRRTLGVVIPH